MASTPPISSYLKRGETFTHSGSVGVELIYPEIPSLHGYSSLDNRPTLCFSSHPASPGSIPQGEAGPGNPHIYSPLLALPILVHRASSPFYLPTSTPSSSPESPHSTREPDLPLHPIASSLHGLVFGWGSGVERRCSTRLRDVLNHSCRSSTRTCYQAKWRCFVEWTAPSHHTLNTVCIPTILEYLLSLCCSGLAHSSVQTHLAAIGDFLPAVDGVLVFAHPATAYFLHSLLNTFLLIKKTYSPVGP